MKDFLLELAKVAEKQTLSRFRKPISVENKESNGAFDPVTEADKEAEKVIRDLIRQQFPGDAIIGEEHATENESAANGWIIDPIDGTRAFVSGIPMWGTLVGRIESGKMTSGLMSQPFTGEAYVADQSGSYLVHKGHDEKLNTSRVAKLADATIMTTSPRIFSAETQPIYDRVEHACQLARYGADCYAYALLAAGHVELVMEAGLNSYDIAALIPIVENAGGIVRTWNGDDAVNGGNILAAANTKLLDQAMDLIGA